MWEWSPLKSSGADFIPRSGIVRTEGGIAGADMVAEGIERAVVEMRTGEAEVRVDPRGDSGVVRDDVDEVADSGRGAVLLEIDIAETGGVERVVAEMITGAVEVRVDPRGDSGVVREDVDEL